MSAQVVFLRPAAVEHHVRRVARRLGCDADTTRKAVQRSALEMRLGSSAHRAIVAGVEVAAASKAIERRRRYQPQAPSVGRCAVVFVVTLAALFLITYLTSGA